jgi:hypothetical protein
LLLEVLVKQKISIVLFWALIVLSLIALSRMTWHDWRGSLRTTVFVVPLILVTNWFQSRFKGSKRRTAMIVIDSALFSVLTGSFLLWNYMLLRSNYPPPGSSTEGIISGLLFLASSAVFVWSLRRLLRRQDKVPT